MIRLFIKACKAFMDGKDMAPPPPEQDLGKIRCPECKSPSKKARNGNYKRQYVTIIGGVIVSSVIKVSLIRCRSCDTAHALLPATVVPHSPFSVIFIAHLTLDRLDRRFSSIEALCDHYGIAINTFYRLQARFLSSVKIAYGIASAKDHLKTVACLLLKPTQDQALSFLSSFYEQTGTSFCEPRAP